ncbi:targeting protein for Xklp2-B-like [Diretmus argenteus]
MAQSDSNSYEFDAPSHVFDFEDVDEGDNADRWFEIQASGAAASMATPSRAIETHVEDPGPSASSSPPSNLVTSWGDRAPVAAQTKGKLTARVPAQPRRVSKRKMREMMTSAPVAPPVKKQKGPTSSEEQELDRITNLQRVVAEHRKKNEASYKAALAGSQLPKKVALTTTVPKEFHFSTDDRVKVATASDTAQKEVDFIAQLRKHPSSPAKAPKGATVPKPFNLSVGSKRKADQPADYVPMAQQIQQLQRRTPARYHLRSRRSQERGPLPVKGDQLRITHPHTPQLMTRQRNRPTNTKSSAELEAEELDKIHNVKFKARELNRKILEGAVNPKKPAAKEPTKPEGFELQIEKRLQERQATKKPEEATETQQTFHALPLPVKILEQVVGVPEKKILHVTVPECPAFALKKRIRMDRKVEEVKPAPVKVNPAPHFGLPFQPQLTKNQVEVCPFSFEERERERKLLTEKRLEEMRNEEVPKFKAQLLPNFDVVVLPEKKVVEPTKPEPFRLLIDQRGATKTDRWEQMVKEEQKQQAEAVIFKARPNTVVHKEPFQPKKEAHTKLVAEPFELSTQRRARQREEFDRQASEREALRACIEEEQRKEEQQHEKEEVAKLRQEQVHKAQGVRHYKPVLVKKSEVALTVPHSPNFSDRFRL